MNALHKSGIFTAVLYANIGAIIATQCNLLLSDKINFDETAVVGNSWRIYHTWNMVMENECFDMTFKNATPEMINRIARDMRDYVEYQPDWNAGTLVVTMGNADREMLLIADGTAGNFIGVPNLVRDENSITISKLNVLINKFFLKLLHYGRYLLMADCTIGVTTLSALEKPQNQTEVASIVSTLPLSKGDSACVPDKVDERKFP